MALALQRMNMRVAAAPAVVRSSAFLSTPVVPRLVLAPAKAAPVTVVVEAKLKTRKAAAKRFKVTSGGVLMARKAGKQHLNEKMSRDQKRALSNTFVMSSANVNQAIKCLPNHSIGK